MFKTNGCHVYVIQTAAVFSFTCLNFFSIWSINWRHDYTLQFLLLKNVYKNIISNFVNDFKRLQNFVKDKKNSRICLLTEKIPSVDAASMDTEVALLVNQNTAVYNWKYVLFTRHFCQTFFIETTTCKQQNIIL